MPSWCGQGQLDLQYAGEEFKNYTQFFYSTICTQEQMHTQFSTQSPNVDTFAILVHSNHYAICTEQFWLCAKPHAHHILELFTLSKLASKHHNFRESQQSGIQMGQDLTQMLCKGEAQL
jgi:hypothetical protein